MSIPEPLPRVAAFEKMGFGIFVHWGLYSQWGRGEWAQRIYEIHPDEYAKWMDTFTAEDFNARELAEMAKKAGAKYITLTTRHHEGFSLYDTCGLNEFDAPHSPAKRDLVREFVDACREFDIVPFFYHTTLDWHHPDFKDNFPTYLQYLRNSVEVLCTQYGKIGGLWFDGNWSRPNDDWEEDALYSLIRRHQPDAIIVNNTGLDARGHVGNLQLDSVTFEQGRPTPMNREGMPKYIAAEMCHTMNRHWGHGANDFNYKSLAHLIETLCACRRVGANYLLNVGPLAEGNISIMQQALMEGIGDWIRATGNVIYSAKPCGVEGDGKNFGLRDGNKLYLLVHDLSIVGDSNVTVNHGGTGTKDFRGITEQVSSVRWIDCDEQLNFHQEDGVLHVDCTGYPYGKNLVVRVAEVTFA